MVVPAYPSAGGPGNASRTIGERKLRYLYLQLEDVLRKLSGPSQPCRDQLRHYRTGSIIAPCHRQKHLRLHI